MVRAVCSPGPPMAARGLFRRQRARRTACTACATVRPPLRTLANASAAHRAPHALRSQAHISMGDIDLLHPPKELEQRRHKLKRLVQTPNSFFMDVKCPGCFNITTVFSHAQTVVICSGCSTVLCQPTGGKARLTEGCSFRKKVE